MQKILDLVTRNNLFSVILACLFLIAGILFRGQFFKSNFVVSLIVPLFFMSLGFGILFCSIFRSDKNPVGLFIKSVLAPWAIVITILVFNKTGIDSPILKAGALFLINIAFFNREINKALNYKG